VRRSVVGLVGRPDAPLDQVRDQLVAAEATALADLEQFERERLRAAAQQHQVSQLRAEADVARALGELLKTSNFQQWLLEEAMDDLVARATVRLHELTSGQYSLVAGRLPSSTIATPTGARRRNLSGADVHVAGPRPALADSADLAAEVPRRWNRSSSTGVRHARSVGRGGRHHRRLGATGRMVIVTHIRDWPSGYPQFEVAKGLQVHSHTGGPMSRARARGRGRGRQSWS
jgi:hypothetical protein